LNNKNTIKKLNEAPINTRQENGKNGAEEKSRKKEEKKKIVRNVRSKGRRKKERLICCASAAPAATKTSYRERYRGHTKKITRDNYAHKSEC